MIAALPAELLLPWYSSFYMMTLPLFLYTAFVFRNIFGLKKKRSALLRTLLTDLLQYVYMFLITLAVASCAVGCYYFIAPEQFKKEFSFDRGARAGQPDDAETTAFPNTKGEGLRSLSPFSCPSNSPKTAEPLPDIEA